MTKPRGVLVLKSTVAASKEFNLAPIVIDEITVLGSRCGQFPAALRLLKSEKIDFFPMIQGNIKRMMQLKLLKKQRKRYFKSFNRILIKARL